MFSAKQIVVAQQSDCEWVIQNVSENYVAKGWFKIFQDICKIWNEIPAAVRNASTVQTFKHRLKTHLFSLTNHA